METHTHDFAVECPGPVAPTNGLGTVGFVLSLFGLGCGLLAPVGLFLSLFGLGRQPRGMAIAGTVIGGVGSLLWIGGLFVAMVLPAVVEEGQERLGGLTRTELEIIGAALEDYRQVRGDWPPDLEALVVPDSSGRVWLESKRGLLPTDPWNRPYEYLPPGRGGDLPSLFSLGSDGEPGGRGEAADLIWEPR